MNSIMETVCVVCNTVRDKTAQGLSFQKMLNHVRREFRSQEIYLTIKTVRDKTLNQETFYANGYYDPEDDKAEECPIELVITHNFPKDHVWYPKHSTDVLIQIFDTVVHELRHQRQYRKRKFLIHHRSNGHEEYLSDPEEIDAYSISIAIELCRSMGKTRALRYLKNISTLARYKINGLFVSPSLSMYAGSFPNPNNPVMLRLAKKVYVRLKKVDTDSVFI